MADLNKIYDLLKRSRSAIELVGSYWGDNFKIIRSNNGNVYETMDGLIEQMDIHQEEFDDVLKSLERMIKIENATKNE